MTDCGKTSGSAFEAAFAERLGQPVDPETSPLARAVAIHRNTHFKALHDALSDNYPVVRALMGPEAFAGCAYAYALDHPPLDPRLCVYGEAFAPFVAGFAPLVGQAEAPSWFGDVAQVERMIVEALFAADAPALDGAATAARLAAGEPIAIHPAARLAVLDSPAVSIWRAHAVSGGALLDPNVFNALVWQGEIALVTRPEAHVDVTPLSVAASAFLKALMAGDGFEAAAQAAVLTGGDPSAAFSTLIVAGVFA